MLIPANMPLHLDEDSHKDCIFVRLKNGESGETSEPKSVPIAENGKIPFENLKKVFSGIDRNFKLYLVENGKKQLQRLGGKSDSFIPSDTWVYSKDVYLLEAP